MMKMNQFLGVLAAAVIGLAASTAGATVILVDFADPSSNPASPDTNGNQWNSAVEIAGASNLIDIDGNPTGVGLTFGGSIADSGATGQWGRTQSPPWAVSNALDDRLFLGNGNLSGSVTFTGLTPGGSYDIELATSYSGSAGRAAGFYNLVDANGVDGNGKGVTAVNVFTGDELTFDNGQSKYTWTTNVNGTGGEEGWIGWFDAVADTNGELRLELATGSDSASRASLNAMEISFEDTVIPEPASAGLLALGAMGLLVRRRRLSS